MSWTAFILILLIETVALTQMGLMVLGSWEHRRFAKSRSRRRPQLARTPQVALFVPCRGLDVGLEGNLRPLLSQDYPSYEVAFIVESRSDPAHAAIERVLANPSHVPARIVVAGHAIDCGQKVHNLRAATGAISPDIEILAFVDSDARPNPDWLARLVERLERPEVGAVTGYRCFVPARERLAERLLSAVNFSVAALLGPGGHHLLWGGSWAIRREVFDRLGIRAAWNGVLNDDLVASRAIRRGGLTIEYEPGCTVATPLETNAASMFEFLRRQYLQARCYVPRWWLAGLCLMSFATLAFWGNLTATIAGLLFESSWMPWTAAALAGLWIGHTVRACLRQDASRFYRPAAWQALRGARILDLVAAPLVTAVNWLGIVSSAFGRSLVWRGIRYEIGRDGRVRIVSRPDEPAATPPRSRAA